MFNPENVISHKEIEVTSDQDIERPIEVIKEAEEELSVCCGAPIVMETFCSDCKEHCK